ncbi:hypothetical protein ACFWUP_02345 [Nocardia sp. NPDC058658]|uniref:hypothetical protein n=1 Tax=Nocardia sp. NPDC058658 TaxID=3346580 RepID=UPI0036482C12
MTGLITTFQPAAFGAATGSQRKAAGIEAGAAGTDPAYIQMMEEFSKISHADLYAKAQQMQPGVMTQSAEALKAIGTALTGNVIGITGKVNATIARGWEGQTAQAITAATRAMTGRLTELQNVTQSVAWRVEAAAFGAEAVKAQIQPPPAPRIPLIPGAESPAVAIASAKEQSDAWQAAIWTMRNSYVPTYEPAGQGVPVFPTSSGLGNNDIPVGTGGASSSPSNGSADGGAGAGSGAETATAADSAQSTDAGTNSSESGSAGKDSGTDDGSGSGSQSEDTETAAAGTEQPGSSTPGTSQPGTPTGSGSPSASGPGTGGTGVPGTGAPGGSGAAVGSPGAKAVPSPGNPVRGGAPANAGAGASTGGSGARAAAGAHGMPGMGAPGAGRQRGSDDDEHKGRAELLMHPRNRRDLIGPPQGTVPPVIGARPEERSAREDRESR